jgi:hypothetical protein
MGISTGKCQHNVCCGYFILQYLYKNGITPEIITRGAKILSLTVSEMNIKLIDSLCFIPMKLAAFPKTFGLTEHQKGYNILAISLAIHTTSSKPEKILLLILSVVRTLLKFYIFIYLKFFGQNKCLLAFLL